MIYNIIISTKLNKQVFYESYKSIRNILKLIQNTLIQYLKNVGNNTIQV